MTDAITSTLRYGTDVLALDDLSATAGGDAALVIGVDCLLQDLLHRWQTPRGSYEPHPEYGSDVFQWLHAAMDAHALLGIAVDLEEAAEEDPRVDEARVRAELDGDDQVRITAEITPIGIENPLNLVLNLATDTLTLELLNAR